MQLNKLDSKNISNETMLEILITGKLEPGFISELVARIFSESMSSYQVAAALALLRAKGENGNDLAEAASSVLERAHSEERPAYLFGDIVGTGGDGHHTINISTLASLTAASLGMPIAKHGNSSVSSRCGSADVLQQMGLNIYQQSKQARRSLDELRWCFLFAPTYHPSFKAVSEVRKVLKIKTLFNLLGPLVNPWSPRIIVLGVYDPRFITPCIDALRNLGTQKALVVHGSGLDEIALHGPTLCALLQDNLVSNFTLTPADLGLGTYSLEEIKGADPEHNAREFLEILSGRSTTAKLSMTAASAGALLWLGGLAPNIKDGVDKAFSALSHGVVLKTWHKILEFNRA